MPFKSEKEFWDAVDAYKTVTGVYGAIILGVNDEDCWEALLSQAETGPVVVSRFEDHVFFSKEPLSMTVRMAMIDLLREWPGGRKA